MNNKKSQVLPNHLFIRITTMHVNVTNFLKTIG